MSNSDLVSVVSLKTDPSLISDLDMTGASHPYVDLPAIFAGAVVAVAISTIMGSFGVAVGLSASSPFSGSGISGAALAIATGLWVVWVAISSFATGGYLAGRMRRRVHDASEHESDVRDGSHGLVVWALGAILLAYLSSISATGLVKTSAAPIAGSTALSLPAAGIADRLLAPMPSGAPPASASNLPNYRASVVRVVNDSLLSGKMIDESNKLLLTSEISSQTGVASPEAAKRVEIAQQEITVASNNMKLAADKLRKIGILVAFLTAATLVISAAASWWAATIGGQHRDDGVDLSHLTAWR